MDQNFVQYEEQLAGSTCLIMQETYRAYNFLL